MNSIEFIAIYQYFFLFSLNAIYIKHKLTVYSFIVTFNIFLHTLFHLKRKRSNFFLTPFKNSTQQIKMGCFNNNISLLLLFVIYTTKCNAVKVEIFNELESKSDLTLHCKSNQRMMILGIFKIFISNKIIFFLEVSLFFI